MNGGLNLIVTRLDRRSNLAHDHDPLRFASGVIKNGAKNMAPSPKSSPSEERGFFKPEINHISFR
jgi:hypothetical protein